MIIEKVFEKHRKSLMELSRVIGVGLIEIQNKKTIAVFVFKDKWFDDAIKNIPKILNGYDVHIIPTYRIQSIGMGRLF